MSSKSGNHISLSDLVQFQYLNFENSENEIEMYNKFYKIEFQMVSVIEICSPPVPTILLARKSKPGKSKAGNSKVDGRVFSVVAYIPDQVTVPKHDANYYAFIIGCR